MTREQSAPSEQDGLAGPEVGECHPGGRDDVWDGRWWAEPLHETP